MWPPSLVTAIGDLRRIDRRDDRGATEPRAGTQDDARQPRAGDRRVVLRDGLDVGVAERQQPVRLRREVVDQRDVRQAHRRLQRRALPTVHGAFVNFASPSSVTGAATARHAASTSSSALPASCR